MEVFQLKRFLTVGLGARDLGCYIFGAWGFGFTV